MLNNRADMFDWADTIPGSLLPQIESKAKSRYHLKNLGGSVYYFFLNDSKPPFNNLDAREAVVDGLNESPYPPRRRDPEASLLLPAAGDPGSPEWQVPDHWGTGDLKPAKTLVVASGQANVPIMVYSEQRSRACSGARPTRSN